MAAAASAASGGGTCYSAANLPRCDAICDAFSGQMAYRLLTDLDRRFPSPTLGQIVAMLLDPRTARGFLSAAIDEHGNDSVGMTWEERKRGLQFLKQAVQEVEEAQEMMAQLAAADKDDGSSSSDDDASGAAASGSDGGGAEIREEPQEDASSSYERVDLFAQFNLPVADESPSKKRRVASVPGNAPKPAEPAKAAEKIDELAVHFEDYSRRFNPNKCLRKGSEYMKGKPDLQENPMTAPTHTDVKGFFHTVIAPALPAVYRVSLKYLRTMASSSFQERVFSAAKRTMTLKRTSLGPELFGALVMLRHNSAHLRAWMQAEEVEPEEVFAAAAKIVLSAVEEKDDAAIAEEMRGEIIDALAFTERNGGMAWGKAAEKAKAAAAAGRSAV